MSYYDSIAPGYNELHAEEQLAKYRIIKELLQLPADAKVLDVGAGTGIGYSVIHNLGIDPSPELIKQHPNKASIVGSAEHLAFPDNSFDAVLCVTAIHHTDYKQALKEMLRVSRGPVAVTILKKSSKLAEILAHIESLNLEFERFEEDKDVIIVLRKA